MSTQQTASTRERNGFGTPRDAGQRTSGSGVPENAAALSPTVPGGHLPVHDWASKRTPHLGLMVLSSVTRIVVSL